MNLKKRNHSIPSFPAVRGRIREHHVSACRCHCTAVELINARLGISYGSGVPDGFLT